MVEFKRMMNTESNDFQQVWNLYVDSFPKNERRDIAGQAHILKLKNYYCQSVYKDELCVGLLFWWDFKTLKYIEHLAIIPTRQNEGLGSLIMKNFLNQDNSKLILLEVEPPITEIQKKRVQFYKKLDFKMNGYNYMQPAYQKTTKPIPLTLLTFPSLLNNENYQEFITTCHSEIYSHLVTK